VAPLIDGGALRAKKRSAQAAYDQVLAQYRDTLLQALQGVSDALAAIDEDSKTLDAQRAVIANAKASSDLAQAQLKIGSGTQQQVLSARVAVLQAEVNLGQQQANRLINTVALYEALGGGWSTQSPSASASASSANLTTESYSSHHLSRVEAKP
jgi:outer membrane protein TolC